MAQTLPTPDPEEAPPPPRRRSAVDLTRAELQKGRRPGDQFIRVTPHPDFRPVRPGHLV